jgi:hypothetical protein
MSSREGEDWSLDDAEMALCQRLSALIREVSNCVRVGHHDAVHTAWSGGETLAEAIHDLALTKPGALKRYARGEIFLPSLRARSKVYTHDFEEVSKAIELSEDCVIDTGEAALHQLDSAATRFTAQVLQKIADWKQTVEFEERRLAGYQAQANAEPGGPFGQFRGMSFEDYWRRKYPLNPEAPGYRTLPPLTKKTAPEWYEKAVKPYLIRAETLEQIKGTPLYAELCMATTSGKDFEVRDELKRRCQPKVRALARP